MKKRIVLILAFGISFSPAAFAFGEQSATGIKRTTGQHDRPSEFQPGMVTCKYDSEKGSLRPFGSSSQTSGAQGTARSAR